MPSPVRYAEVKAYIESGGWVLARINGSHHIFVRSGKRNIVIVVHGGKVKPAYVRQAKKIIEGD